MSAKKQIGKFILVGIGAVLIDFITYKILLPHLNYSISKTLSFLTGAGFAYIANKFFTFKKPNYCGKEIIKFTALYLLALIINVLVNKLSLVTLFFIHSWLGLTILNESNIILLAFLAATATSTVLNFIGQKFWVFQSHN